MGATRLDNGVWTRSVSADRLHGIALELDIPSPVLSFLTALPPAPKSWADRVEWGQQDRDEWLGLFRRILDFYARVHPDPAAETPAPAPDTPQEPMPERFQRRNSWTPERRAAASERAKQGWTPERRARYAEMASARFGKGKGAAEGEGDANPS